MGTRATARACANIAFVKYWGNMDSALRLPFNDSVSMNLDRATTATSVELDSALDQDEVAVDGQRMQGAGLLRVVRHLDVLRARAGSRTRMRVDSCSTFPMGTGMASSASGFAALTVAGAAALGLELGEAQLSALARRGSGSAARSIPDGFVWWRCGADHESSFASSLAGRRHWDLCDVVAVVSREHKRVGSTSGHEAAVQSPHFAARLAALPARLALAHDAILGRSLETLGPMLEDEALSLHAVALTGRPPLIYFTGATVAVMAAVVQWRREGLPVYYTLDAGPNVHLLCEGRHAADVEARARALECVKDVIACGAGGPAALVD